MSVMGKVVITAVMIILALLKVDGKPVSPGRFFILYII